jgi:hypothetical protein
MLFVDAVLTLVLIIAGISNSVHANVIASRILYTITGCFLYFVKYFANARLSDKRLRSSTVDFTYADYWVCGLSVQDCKSLMTNYEGGKGRDLAPSVRTESQQKSRTVYMNNKPLL